jgi:hypothetical protein
MGRKVVGSRAGGRREQYAVADELLEPRVSVDDDLDLNGLIARPEQRHLVECQRFMPLALGVDHLHAQRVDVGGVSRREALAEPVLLIVVHQEADGAEVHAVDRHAAVHDAVQRLKHQPIAAERDDHVGTIEAGLTVARPQLIGGVLGLRRAAGDKADAAELVRQATAPASWVSPGPGAARRRGT